MKCIQQPVSSIGTEAVMLDLSVDKYNVPRRMDRRISIDMFLCTHHVV